MGILCGAAEGTRTECFLPGGGETLAGAVAADNSAAMAAALEVYSQTSREDCVPGHFGFASMDEMFVLNGCQGSFLYYPAVSPLLSLLLLLFLPVLSHSPIHSSDSSIPH